MLIEYNLQFFAAKSKSLDWSEGIKATQEVISGTNIPRSFVMEGLEVGGKEI